MNYYYLGTNCIPRTMALTSNEKFLEPLNEIYYKSEKHLAENDTNNYFRFSQIGREDIGDDLLDTNPRLEIKRGNQFDDALGGYYIDNMMYGRRLKSCKNC